MKHSRIISSLVIAACVALSLNAQNQDPPVDYGVGPLDFSRVGTAGWQFLKIPVNARSAAMGDVRTSLKDGDAGSAFNNPATAADVQNLDVSFNKMEWVADISVNALSVIKNFQEWGVVGVHLVYLDYGDMIRTENSAIYNQLGTQIGIVPIYEGLGTFSAHDMAIGLLYTRQVTDKLQVGGTVRYLEEQLDDAKTKNWGLNLGTYYQTGFESLCLSMVLRDFGPDAEFVEYDERIQRTPARVKMPMSFAIGASYELFQNESNSLHNFLLACEYIIPNDGNDKFNLGGEYTFNNLLKLRVGYKFNYDELDLTFGAGINYSLDDITLRIDYAYINTGIFNSVHMFSVGFGL